MLNYLQKEAKTAKVSIDMPCGSDRAGITIAESLPDLAPAVADTAERNFLVEQLHLAMDRLPNKERLALCGVFIEDQEPKTVASCLQVTPSHLSRLQKQGMSPDPRDVVTVNVRDEKNNARRGQWGTKKRQNQR